MDPMRNSFSVEVPRWVVDRVTDIGSSVPSLAEAMALANDLASRNVEDGGGPFAALVVERGTGVVLSAGVNRVVASGLSVMHAEVVALSLAQARVGSWTLASGRPVDLVANARPCLQCCGAVLWSGVARLVIPTADEDDVGRLTGFDEGPLPEDWVRQYEQRGIEVVTGLGVEDARKTFRAYAARVNAGTAVRYSPRPPTAPHPPNQS